MPANSRWDLIRRLRVKGLISACRDKYKILVLRWNAKKMRKSGSHILTV